MRRGRVLAGFWMGLFLAFAFAGLVFAEGGEEFAALSGKMLFPMEDGSGLLLQRTDVYTCVSKEGKMHNAPAVHYFHHFRTGGAVLDGYYYHDASGKFAASSPRLLRLTGLSCMGKKFDGIYMVNLLGHLDAAPQIRHLQGVELEGEILDGYYYFDSLGRLSADISTDDAISMISGQEETWEAGLEGGTEAETEGAKETATETVTEETKELETEPVTEGAKETATETVTEETKEPETEPVTEGAKETATESATEETTQIETQPVTEETGEEQAQPSRDLAGLRGELADQMASLPGTWSVYIQDLSTRQILQMGDHSQTSASLIKLFAMEATYARMDEVRKNLAAWKKTEAADPKVADQVYALLENMIIVSDNESFNELVRLHDESHDFNKGARAVNAYLEDQGYGDTLVQHTLAPAPSAPQGLGGKNMTSAVDCGLLLERIYQGTCVGPRSSNQMLQLLLHQTNTTKIRTGIPPTYLCANKTGETDTTQHDAAIVYGTRGAWILTVLSADCPEFDAIDHIREIAAAAVKWLG